MAIVVPAAFSLTDHSSWPQPALTYWTWYKSQPVPLPFYVAYFVAIVALIGWGLTTLGLWLFWSPARYIYGAFFALNLLGDFTYFPTLAAGWERLLNDLAQLAIGAILALIFASPGRDFFRRRESRA